MEVSKVIKQIVANQQTYEVRLSWDNSQRKNSEEIDLDLQCVILDDLAQIEDVVYFNQQTSSLVNVKLSDDQRGSSQGSQDEVMHINLSDASYGIKYLVILICSHDGIPLNKLNSAILEIKADNKSILRIQIGNQEDCISFLPCIFQKQYDGAWILHQTDVADKNGKTFIECEYMIRKGLLKCGFDEGLFQEAKTWYGNKSFNLKKEDVLLIPNTIANNEIFVGLGWDTRCDIDSSILTFDKQGNLLENIYFGNLRSKNLSIIHHGDNLTGEGDGDDEVITIKLSQMDQSVHTIWSVITIYTVGKSLQDVSGAFCRLVDSKSKKEFCKYNLSQVAKQDTASNGSIMACIQRYKNNCWAIQPKGYLTTGQRVSSGVAPIVKKLLNNDLSQVKLIKDDVLMQKQKSLDVASIQKQKSLAQNRLQMNLQSISGINIIGRNNNKTSNTYAIIKVNQQKIGQTETILNTTSPNWNQQFQLKLVEGDIIKLKVMNYKKMYFDDFLGKASLKVTQEMLQQSSVQEFNLQILDKKRNPNPKFTGSIKLNLV